LPEGSVSQQNSCFNQSLKCTSSFPTFQFHNIPNFLLQMSQENFVTNSATCLANSSMLWTTCPASKYWSHGINVPDAYSERVISSYFQKLQCLFKNLSFYVGVKFCLSKGKTWARTFREYGAWKIFWPKMEELTRNWTKLHNKELHALYCSPSIIRVI